MTDIGMAQAWKSESIASLAAALAAAQGKILGAAKSAENPHFKSKYADLASIVDACRAALSENGLAVVQFAESDGDRATVVTILTHKSGEWMRGSITLKPMKADAQGIGSALTYGRRYGLAAMVGVAPEDDDGNAASQAPKGQVNGQRATPGRAASNGSSVGGSVAMMNLCREWSGVPAEDARALCREVGQRIGVVLSASSTDADFGKVANEFKRFMGEGVPFPLPPEKPPAMPPPGEDISDHMDDTTPRRGRGTGGAGLAAQAAQRRT